MEKKIWIILNDKKELIQMQRMINLDGSMRSVCLISTEAVIRAAKELEEDSTLEINRPSLILLDYEMSEEEKFAAWNYIQDKQHLASIPLFFMTSERTREKDEDCYEKGAIVVLQRPFRRNDILRIERMAWQHEVTRNLEKKLYQQAEDINMAKKIKQLNGQLTARNELLYQLFGRYFSDKVTKQILESQEKGALTGEQRDVVVLISDLRGFTSVSGQMKPEEVTRLLNYYFEQMTEIIYRNGGVIIEFMGDSILAVFGAPAEVPNMSEMGIVTAIEMQNAMEKVSGFCAKYNFPELEMGIGVHRGEVFIGNVGSERMMRYNIIGNAVNECSRVESMAIGGQVLVTENVLHDITSECIITKRESVNTKGVSKAMTIADIIGLGEPYNAHMKNIASEAMVPLKEKIILNMFRVSGKYIQQIPDRAKLKEISRKRALIKLDSAASDLEEYTNVELIAVDQNGNVVFNGVYAKITGREKRNAVLHFTTTTPRFELFVKERLYGWEEM